MTVGSQTITEKLDAIKHLTEKGVEYWYARELLPIVGYSEWRNFKNALRCAMAVFGATGEYASHHFVETTKVMEVGRGAEMVVDDYFLSRPACYLVAMNGDPSKPEIADAQRYFAVRTRQMEKMIAYIGDVHHVTLRDRVKMHHTEISDTAQKVGVRKFGVFHGAGIKAMYNMSLAEIKLERGLNQKEDWLDRQGVEELAGNDFRVTQTDSKIQRENIRGEQNAIRAHQEVAAAVRGTIKELGNTLPENLPVEPPIKEIEKRLRPTAKQIVDC